jgi:hypothetical protein
MAWCGLTNDQAKDGMRELKRASVIEDTGDRIGRAIVWRLAPTAAGLNVEAGTPAVEGLERSLTVDPPIPPDDQRFVNRTQAGACAHVGVCAHRDAAAGLGTRGHVNDDKPLIGRQARLEERAPALADPPWMSEFVRGHGGGA